MAPLSFVKKSAWNGFSRDLNELPRRYIFKFWQLCEIITPSIILTLEKLRNFRVALTSENDLNIQEIHFFAKN